MRVVQGSFASDVGLFSAHLIETAHRQRALGAPISEAPPFRVDDVHLQKKRKEIEYFIQQITLVFDKTHPHRRRDPPLRADVVRLQE